MYSRRLKTGYSLSKGSTLSRRFIFYYFYFFMQQAFGFGNRANLVLAALNGAGVRRLLLVGRRFAQRFGYFTALKLGLDHPGGDAGRRRAVPI